MHALSYLVIIPEKRFVLYLLLLRPQRQWGLICCAKGNVLLLLYISLLEAVKSWFQNISTNTLEYLHDLFAVILLLFFPLTLAFNVFFSLCLWRAHWAVQCSVGSCGAICAAVFQLWEGRYATESPVISREGRAIITGCVKRVTESEAPVVLTAAFSLIYVEMLPGVFLGATGRQQYKCCRMLLLTVCSCF